MSSADQESHPLFPSGEWEGFYTYATSSQASQHPMHLFLSFKNSVVTGGGSDDVGRFTWKGSYSKQQLECTITKNYSTHIVSYIGQVDENGIWGIWHLDGISGGFHIWPKMTEQNQQVQAVEIQEESIKEEVHLTTPKSIFLELAQK